MEWGEVHIREPRIAFAPPVSVDGFNKLCVECIVTSFAEATARQERLTIDCGPVADYTTLSSAAAIYVNHVYQRNIPGEKFEGRVSRQQNGWRNHARA
jgi:hypothetical protein